MKKELNRKELLAEVENYITDKSLIVNSKKRSLLMVVGYTINTFLWILFAVLIFKMNNALLVCSIIMLLISQRHLQTHVHDTAHFFLSDNRKTNDIVGNFLYAGFIGMNIANYRAIHQKHHKFNGSAEDPEYFSYDEVKNSGGLVSLCLRYFFGLEALKLVKKYYFSKQVNKNTVQVKSKFFHVIFCQLLLISCFAINDLYFFYIIWVILAVTVSPLLSRLRFLVEHPGKNDTTRSTTSLFIEKVFFAPHSFNYHFEHHMWPMVPPYNLSRIHRHIRKNNFFKKNKNLINTYYFSDLFRAAKSYNVN